MAGPNAGEIRVAGSGRILIAPVGTAAPADTVTAWGANWLDLGYTSTAGVKLTKKDKIDPVHSWQSASAARLIFAERDLKVHFQMIQINGETLPFFLGGDPLIQGMSTATPPVPTGIYQYNLPTIPGANEKALGIEFTDGAAITYRIVIPRGQVTDTEDMTLTRTAAISLGVTYTALATNDANPLATFLMGDKGLGD
ncbi:hypothetical protein P3T36_003194 [Kitasatospora sp. MAP12-15]|uniref:phage tail tube protein n=1 Tax=unclassified Kitasatospora TaxID=2633591 RepID=UPI0024766E0B|nr:phage tail protein [Kitasatospora sp. MAP12-44]MDH6111170.1 hypothetical protein [Kitasatospora sp. MAP12-44]